MEDMERSHKSAIRDEQSLHVHAPIKSKTHGADPLTHIKQALHSLIINKI